MKSELIIDSAGRVVLPSEARRRLNLRPGSRLRLAVVAERLELTPAPESDVPLVQSTSRRQVLQATGKAFDAAAATRAERDVRARPRKSR
jgi:AbrB family looped-hinge helix DNA binding protein